MSKFEVFDPAMCCSTGVCGPAIDPDLARFAADLAWLGDQGVEVRRYNLAQEPAAFAQQVAVADALRSSGTAALPVVLVDGRVQATGAYPSRQELAAWAGITAGEPAAAPAPCCGPKGCC